MLPDGAIDGLVVLDAIADPIVLVEPSGRVIAGNTLAFVRIPDLAPGTRLHDFVHETPETTTTFLRLAARSTSPIPGRLPLGGETGKRSRIRTEGSLMRPATADREAILMIRWHESPISVAFAELNQKVEGLNNEVRRWQAMHAERAQLLRKLEHTARLYQQEVELLETVTGNISTALFMLDEQGRPTFVNPAAERLFGYSPRDVGDRHFHHTFHRNRLDGSPFPIEDCPLALALSSRQPAGPYEDIFISKDGSQIPVMALAVPIQRSGESAGMVIEAQDHREVRAREARITQLNNDLRHTVEELAAASAAKDEFLGMVSHELKNPLTTVVGIARHLEQRHDQLDRQSLSDSLHVLSQDATRMAEIIENMLALSRAESHPPELEPIMPSRIVESVVAHFRTRRNRRECTVRIASDGALALGNPGWFEQIVRNLLSNAYKYSDPGEPVEVLVQSTASHVEVRVLDRGPGISEEDSKRLFDAFVRGKSGNINVYGLGLGLSVCRRLVQLMDGEITVQQRTDISGTEAMFRIPLLEAD